MKIQVEWRNDGILMTACNYYKQQIMSLHLKNQVQQTDEASQMHQHTYKHFQFDINITCNWKALADTTKSFNMSDYKCLNKNVSKIAEMKKPVKV